MARCAPSLLRRAGSLDELPGWTFLTNHAHVLVCIVQDSESRLRDIATQVGITERQARATFHADLPFRHPIEVDHDVGELLGLLGLIEGKKRAGWSKARR